MGALRELRECGLRVPQDTSVTGFDNVKLSEFCYPALTSEIVIDPELVLRDSTGPAPSPLSETSD